MRGIQQVVGLASLVLSLVACSDNDGGPAANGGGSGNVAGSSNNDSGPAPTWHADIAPLVAGHCQGCHQDGGISPFSLQTYEQAKMWSPSFDAVLRDGTMPPFLAKDTEGCKPRFGFKDDLRLTAEQIELFKRWNDAGSPEGDPATAAKLPSSPELELKGAEISVKIPSAVSVAGPGDKFICFSLSPDFTPIKATGAEAALLGDRVLIDGAQITPGNSAIVHHVLVFTDPSGQSAALAGDKGYYDCFGGPQLDDPGLVMAWAPGATPIVAPPGVAMAVPSTGRLVMQVHYHPTGSAQTDDATTLQLRGYGDGIPDYVGSLSLIGNFRNQSSDGMGLQHDADDATSNPEFRIAAGKANHNESMLFAIPKGDAEYRLWAIGSHMHYVGTDMRIGVTRANAGSEPADECLLETPKWDFNWQRGYLYDTPIDQAPALRSGDVINLRCTYDNSMQNPFVAQALAEQGLSAPRDVVLGEETLDEMCLGIFGIAQKVSDLIK
ncbi:MAG TPA: hypothetical protein VEQ58_05770 [Polyangiaceae bacterium]|nr:hypothetical protein [Polyangiaceae bacterium]